MDAVLPRTIYQDMKNFAVVVLMKIYQSKWSDKISTNIICIIFWSNMYMVSINEDIIPKPSF